MRDSDNFDAVVGEKGDVEVGGVFVGHLEGFRFRFPDPSAAASGRTTLMTAVNKALREALSPRVNAFCVAPDREFAIDQGGAIFWSGSVVASLLKGANIITPRVVVLPNDYLSGGQRERMHKRLVDWIDSQLAEALELVYLKNAPLEVWLVGLLTE